MPIQITVPGTLREDGTLELDDRVLMPQGRVLVTLQPVGSAPPDDPFWQTMERIWADQKARGHVPRTKEEIDAELQWLSDEAETEMQANERFYEECQRAREQAEKSEKASNGIP